MKGIDFDDDDTIEIDIEDIIYVPPEPPFKNFASWREFQQETVQRILQSPKRFILLNAPTGSGKSLIAMATGRLGGFTKVIVVTQTKQLQEQYMASFSADPSLDGALVKITGRDNFRCKATAGMVSCAEARCVFDKKLASNNPSKACPHYLALSEGDIENACTYYLEKSKAARAKYVITNYSYYLLSRSWLLAGTSNPLVVFDECHTFEKTMDSILAVRIRRDTEFPPDITTDVKKVMDILSEEIQNVEERISEIKKELQKRKISELSEHYKKLVSEYQRLERRHERLKVLLGNIDIKKYVISAEKTEKNYVLSIAPLWFNEYLPRMMYSSSKMLFMSATILQPHIFARVYGIDEDEMEYLELPCTFNISNRPIYINHVVGWITKKNLESMLPELVRKIDEIICMYPKSRGLIHTVNFAISKYIKEHSAYSDIMHTHESDRDRIAALNEYLAADPPSVLMSPSYEIGLDLPGDKCSYIIWAKMPFADLGDKRVAMRLQEYPQWYQWNTVCRFIQGSGRGWRYENDRCDVYVLDGQFFRVFESCNSMFPEYFRKQVTGRARKV